MELTGREIPKKGEAIRLYMFCDSCKTYPIASQQTRMGEEDFKQFREDAIDQGHYPKCAKCGEELEITVVGIEGDEAVMDDDTVVLYDERPELVLSLEETPNDDGKREVIGVRFGETGYYATTYGEQTQEWVDMMNSRLGVPPYVREAMVVASMFGTWDRYEENLERHRKIAAKK